MRSFKTDMSNNVSNNNKKKFASAVLTLFPWVKL